MVALLASNANQCISELGYPKIASRVRALEKAYADLHRLYTGLQADNARLKELCHAAELKERDSSQRYEACLRAFHELEQNNAATIQQNQQLRYDLSLGSSDAFKQLEARYNCALSVLKDHGIVPAPINPGEVQLSGQSEAQPKATRAQHSPSPKDTASGQVAHDCMVDAIKVI